MALAGNALPGGWPGGGGIPKFPPTFGALGYRGGGGGIDIMVLLSPKGGDMGGGGGGGT
jgi:hypothetical protein